MHAMTAYPPILRLAPLALLALAMLTPMLPAAEIEYYMKMSDVDGESVDDGHKDWIVLLSFSHAINKRVEDFVTTGRSTFTPIVVTKIVDRSSPLLMRATAGGKLLPAVQIEAVNAETQQTYLRYEMKNVLISNWSTSGNADIQPTEQLSLNFEEIKVIYHRYTLGSPDPVESVEMGWSVIDDAEAPRKTE
ncbi:MAG TPA: type VI secretion system tube protein Hcp [Candidatus Sumerlaeota bacterium]|nr:type VI secretion system tube protein Hcp [Candidatus Sumerlaeota bacterium]HOR26502.1 type VI secretion system tube protein Hcp [Candidatus Sumerlaeota bacterium]